jgi:hypothetical protein
VEVHQDLVLLAQVETVVAAIPEYLVQSIQEVVAAEPTTAQEEQVDLV